MDNRKILIAYNVSVEEIGWDQERQQMLYSVKYEPVPSVKRRLIKPQELKNDS